MKLKNSITADEKKLLEYLYGVSNIIADYCHRNNMILPVSVTVTPDYKFGEKVFDYRDVRFSESYPSGNISRIVSMGYNHCTGKAEYNEMLYEDKEE